MHDRVARRRHRSRGAARSATGSAPRSTAASARPSGPDADPRTVSALEMTFFGALVNAGSGAFTYHQIADRLAYVVGLILRRREDLDDRHMTERTRADPRPVRLRLPRGSVPVLPAAARRGPAVPQRGAGLLGAVAARRRAAGLPQQHHAVQPRRRLAGPGRPADRTRRKTMSFLAMDDPGHLRLRTLVSKGFTPAPDSRTRAAGHRARRPAPRRHAGEGGIAATVDYVDEFAGKLPMDVISELMGVPEPDRDAGPGLGRRRDAPRGRRRPTCRRRRSRPRST